MQALVWQGPYRHEVQEVPEPPIRPGEVLVSVALAGICGSDVTAHKGLMGISRPGAVRGHEFGGTVERSQDPRLPSGTRVSVNPVVVCGWCAACTGGRPSSCSHVEILGVHRPGAFAELVAVPVDQVHAVPADLSWAAAASAEPLAQARHDVEQAKRFGALGDCLVIGAGSIGLAVVSVLTRERAGSTTVVDVAPARLDAATAAGATGVATSVDDVPARGFDTVFDVVGLEATRRGAVSRVRNGGTVVAVGLGADESAIGWFDVVRREIVLVGANTFAPDDFTAALGWLADGTVAPPVPSRTVPLGRGGEVFRGIVERTDDFLGKTFLEP